MGAWQPLPDTLEPEVRQLTVRLRELKDATGLSLTALARRTPASKSAWGRYLNGQALPPRAVVAALGELADADPTRLAGLWEVANLAFSHPAALSPSTGTADASVPGARSSSGDPIEREGGTPGPRPEPVRRRGVWRSSLRLLAVALPTMLSTAALTIVLTSGWQSGIGSAPMPAAPSTAPSSTAPAAPHSPSASAPRPSATPMPRGRTVPAANPSRDRGVGVPRVTSRPDRSPDQEPPYAKDPDILGPYIEKPSQKPTQGPGQPPESPDDAPAEP